MSRIRDRRLTREVVVILTIKIAALVLIWSLFFSPEHRVDVKASDVGNHLFETSVSKMKPIGR
ncbi:MAG: hypothetical protein PVF40_08190 [Ectothiorhodospiraceae bacterium]